MTTTLIKTKDLSSQMEQLTGMKSMNFKMVSILFIVILNFGRVSSQTFTSITIGSPILKPTVSYYKKSATVTKPVMFKINHLLLVKNFPLLEGVSKHEMKKAEEQDNFDYELIFGSAAPETKTTGKNTSITSIENNTPKTI